MFAVQDREPGLEPDPAVDHGTDANIGQGDPLRLLGTQIRVGFGTGVDEEGCGDDVRLGDRQHAVRLFLDSRAVRRGHIVGVVDHDGQPVEPDVELRRAIGGGDAGSVQDHRIGHAQDLVMEIQQVRKARVGTQVDRSSDSAMGRHQLDPQGRARLRACLKHGADT